MSEIICGDSAEVLKTFEPDCIDLTVTSPPYDNLRKYNGYTFDFETIARELYRVTRSGGVVVWVVGDATIDGSETGTSFRQALYFKECGFSLHDTMIYEKNGIAFPSTNRYQQSFEYMFVFSKGKPKSVNLITDRQNRWANARHFGKPTKRRENGELKQKARMVTKKNGVRWNIWRYNNGYGYTAEEDYVYQHPAMFPEALANDHILSWSNPGDLVLDCFAGSGTTLKTAKRLGRNYIGIEISPEYCKIIERRVAGANVPLFV